LSLITKEILIAIESGFTGFNKEIYSNGDIYEGDFVDNKRHGNGKMTYPDGKVEEGRWEDGEFKL
jgi:hypothetical protein